MLADADEAVATGACVQAAAVALGVSHRRGRRAVGARCRHTTAGIRAATPQACVPVTPSCDRRPIPRRHEHRSVRGAGCHPRRHARRRCAPLAGGWPPSSTPTMVATPRGWARSTPPSTWSVAQAGASTARRSRRLRGVQHDAPSFTIDCLPVEAFEALLVVTSWMGEVLVDDPAVRPRGAPHRARPVLVPARPGARRGWQHRDPDGRLGRRRPRTRRRGRPRCLGRQPEPSVSGSVSARIVRSCQPRATVGHELRRASAQSRQ